MTPGTEARDVVVIGGGVIGCAVARTLASDLDVLLLEKGRIASEASGLAAGNINPALSYPDRPAIARHISAAFERAEESGAVRFTRRPRVELAVEDARAGARRRAIELRDRGLSVAYVEAERVEAEYPLFDLDGYAGAIRYADGGWVDPHRHTIALRREAGDRGAEFRTGTRVRSIETTDGCWTVRTPSEESTADRLVVAAGWRTGDLLAPLVDLPVKPFLTQCVTIEPPSPLDEDFPMGREPVANLYFRPDRNGDLLVGGGRTSIDNPTAASGGVEPRPDFRRTVAETVPGFLRGFDAAAAGDGWAGVDGATPDGRPIIDAPAVGPDGLVVATGFHGGGIRDSPVAAAVVRSLVLDTSLPFDGAPFALSRFESRSSDFSVSKEYDESTTA